MPEAPKYKLHRRPESPYWNIVWTDGRRSYRRSTRTTDRREAELVLAAFLLEVNKPKEAKQEEVGIASVLQDYYDEYAQHKASHVQADIAVKRLTEFFGTATVAAVTQEAQDRYIAQRRKDGVRDETISRELSVLRAALNRAVKYGRLLNAPFVKSLPKAEPRQRVLTREEAARLLRACRDLHLRLFVRLALYTGARRGAILDLTWDRVDFRNRLIRFPKDGETLTNKRRAIAPMEGALLTAMQRAKTRAKSEYVIEYGGEPVASIKTAFRAAVRRAKLAGVTPHTLRHTAATWAAWEGEELFKISGLLGQRMLSTTERYAKQNPEYLRSTMRAILRGARQKRANRGISK